MSEGDGSPFDLTDSGKASRRIERLLRERRLPEHTATLIRVGVWVDGCNPGYPR